MVGRVKECVQLIAKETIDIKNIYHMLSYAYEIPNNKRYERVQTENFDNILDLISKILVLGVSEQIKQGLAKDYVDVTESTSSIRGKINITESINSLSFLKKRLVCTYDEFSVNSYPNQIIKSTMNLLFNRVSDSTIKADLKKLLMIFSQVDLIDVNSINWGLRLDRNNRTYVMLINLCHLVIKEFIQTEESGKVKLIDFEFEDKFMERLFEKFILNYYIREHGYLHPKSSKIDWQLDGSGDGLLPEMRTDVTLEYGKNVLIIDAKFYKSNTQQFHGKDIHHSNNLYQIFAYVKNKQIGLQENDVNVSGMLLYAKTNEIIQPESDYIMSGNNISVRTLDLNQDFEIIKKQLDDIVEDYLKRQEHALINGN